jgi:hypothetical protein
MDIVVPQLANAVYEDRIRDAVRARRFSIPTRSKRLPSMLKNLLHLFF